MDDSEIKITETETTMEDGSISVYCEALAPTGERVATCYVVSAADQNTARLLGVEVRRQVRKKRDVAHAGIHGKLAELAAPPVPEIHVVPMEQGETIEAFRARITAITGFDKWPGWDASNIEAFDLFAPSTEHPFVVCDDPPKNAE